MAVADCKILYAKSKTGIFPPSEFDARVAFRSGKVPDAHLQLEHVHGYNGADALAPNLYYTYR